MAKRISIIIPVYNRGYCLPRCLDSVLKQTFTDWECILVDDGSTDNSYQVCCEYSAKDTRFQVFRQPENGGVSEARNRGLDLVKGEYIAFVDSDDWIDADYLSLLYQSAGEKTMPLCGMSVYDHNGGIIEVYKMQDKTYRLDNSSTVFFLKYLLTSFIPSPCCRLYSRSIIEEYHLRFLSGVHWGEDMIFNCLYFEYIDNIKCVPALYRVMRQEISLSSSFHKNPLLLENSMKIWHSIDTFLRKKKIYNKQMKSIMQHHYLRLHWQSIFFFYINTGFAVSKKERFDFVRHVMKSVNSQIVKMCIIPKTRCQLKYYPFYNRMTFLIWLFCEWRLLKK